MDISVIVPFYNAEPYIEFCVKALLRQDYPRDCYEIIMIENNSTDRSADIVRKNSRIKLISESTPGSYAARNQGVAESTGSILAFTDADCAPGTNWLRSISNAMHDQVIGVLQGRRRFATEAVSLSILSDYETSKAEFIFSNSLKEKYYAYTNNMAVRRTIFEKYGPFLPVNRGADVLFMQKVIKNQSCQAVKYVPDAFVRHLEITKIWLWYKKMTAYGKSWKTYHKISGYKPLTIPDRLRVFYTTIKRQKYMIIKSVYLLLLLSIGVLYYEIGRRF